MKPNRFKRLETRPNVPKRRSSSRPPSLTPRAGSVRAPGPSSAQDHAGASQVPWTVSRDGRPRKRDQKRKLAASARANPLPFTAAAATLLSVFADPTPGPWPFDPRPPGVDVVISISYCSRRRERADDGLSSERDPVDLVIAVRCSRCAYDTRECGTKEIRVGDKSTGQNISIGVINVCPGQNEATENRGASDDDAVRFHNVCG